MPSSHFILCPLFLLPPIPPSIWTCINKWKNVCTGQQRNPSICIQKWVDRSSEVATEVKGTAKAAVETSVVTSLAKEVKVCQAMGATAGGSPCSSATSCIAEVRHPQLWGGRGKKADQGNWRNGSPAVCPEMPTTPYLKIPPTRPWAPKAPSTYTSHTLLPPF